MASFVSCDLNPLASPADAAAIVRRNCASDARTKHSACQNMNGQCLSKPECANCDQTYQSALNGCVSTCLDCADSKGCYNANASCQSAVGP